MHTLAVTGATGFLGRYLFAECMSRSCFRLRLLLRDRKAFKNLSDGMVTIYEGDLMKPESLNGFLQPNSTLVHLAYLKKSGAANIKVISNIIEAVKQSGIKRVVHCSTAVVIGFGAEGIVTESTTPAPKGEYQRTKYRIEEMLRAELLPSVELAILRPTEIIGPGGRGLQKMIKRLCCEKSYKNIIYHSILKFRRFNYVSVYNVVAALILLATTPVKQMGEIYNISDDDDVDNNYAAVEQIICSSIKKQHKYYLDIGLPRPFLSLLFKLMPNHSPPNRIYSNSKICSLGYKKRITLRSAISEIVSLGVNGAHS